MLFKSCPVLIFSSLLITWYWQGQLFLPAEVVGNEVFKRKDDEKKKKEVVGNETWLAFINVKLFKAHILFSSSMKPSRMCYGALEPENFVVLSFRCSPTVCSPHIVGYIPPAETAQWWYMCPLPFCRSAIRRDESCYPSAAKSDIGFHACRLDYSKFRNTHNQTNQLATGCSTRFWLIILPQKKRVDTGFMFSVI